MRIITDRNMNFHTKLVPGGLIHVNAKKVSRVPDDVPDCCSGFKKLIKSGVVTVLTPQSVVIIPDTEKTDKGPSSTQKSTIPDADDEKVEKPDLGIEDADEEEETENKEDEKENHPDSLIPGAEEE